MLKSSIFLGWLSIQYKWAVWKPLQLLYYCTFRHSTYLCSIFSTAFVVRICMFSRIYKRGSTFLAMVAVWDSLHLLFPFLFLLPPLWGYIIYSWYRICSHVCGRFSEKEAFYVYGSRFFIMVLDWVKCLFSCRNAIESTLFKQWLKNIQTETGLLANGAMSLKQVLIQVSISSCSFKLWRW